MDLLIVVLGTAGASLVIFGQREMRFVAGLALLLGAFVLAVPMMSQLMSQYMEKDDGTKTIFQVEAERMWEQFPTVCAGIPAGKIREPYIISCTTALNTHPFPSASVRGKIFDDPSKAMSIAWKFFQDNCPLIEGEQPVICREYGKKPKNE